MERRAQGSWPPPAEVTFSWRAARQGCWCMDADPFGVRLALHAAGYSVPVQGIGQFGLVLS